MAAKRQPMHRFYLPPEQCRGTSLVLTGDEAHHATRVLRLGPGGRVCVLDGAGQELLCQLGPCRRDEVELAVLERRSHPAPLCSITLIQAIPKGKLFESIVQKSTELGVARVVPLLTERTVPQFSGASEHKSGKWQRVAVEAVKQCGCAWLPKVEAPITLVQALAWAKDVELPLIASLQPGSKHPREHFLDFQTRSQRPPRSVSLWIGPEGDFTPAETELLLKAGVLPITLGPLVLRTDTATNYTLSVVNYEIAWQHGHGSQARTQ
jgi:16S rRNA (uracil1498-N3)-methyltransferase